MSIGNTTEKLLGHGHGHGATTVTTAFFTQRVMASSQKSQASRLVRP
jgi:hypothetical protein